MVYSIEEFGNRKKSFAFDGFYEQHVDYFWPSSFRSGPQYGNFGQSVGHYFAKEVKDHSHLSTDFGTVQGVSVTKSINNRHRLNCFLGTIRND